jgi:hypothetical protein
MRRTDKLTALAAFFAGQPGPVQRLSNVRSKRLEDMSDAELIAIIEAGTGQPCPDFETMSDEELHAIIDKTSQ